MKTDFGKTLKSLRTQLDYTQSEVSSMMASLNTPATKQSISRWEQGINLPNAKQFLSLCKIYQVTDVNAVFGTGRLPHISSTLLNREGRDKVEAYAQDLIASGRYVISSNVIVFPKRKVAIYDLPVSAGSGHFLDSSRYEMVETDDPIAQSANFGVRVSGDSMEPKYHDGSIIWIQQQQDLEDGEIGIFLLNGDAFLKMLRRTQNKVQLISLNSDYAPKDVKDYDDFRVFGKVLN